MNSSIPRQRRSSSAGSIDGGGAGQGCTIVTEAYAAAGYDPAVFGYTPYGPDENGDYWDWQSRPAIWGTDGTYYAQGGYLYEYTRKAQDGYWAVRATGQGKVNYRYGFTEVRMIAGHGLRCLFCHLAGQPRHTACRDRCVRKLWPG